VPELQPLPAVGRGQKTCCGVRASHYRQITEAQCSAEIAELAPVQKICADRRRLQRPHQIEIASWVPAVRCWATRTCQETTSA
jgi:hypothetical protein